MAMFVSMTSDQLMTRAEVAALMKVTNRTVQRWQDDGVLEAVRVGGTIRYRRSDVDQLIAGGAE